MILWLCFTLKCSFFNKFRRPYYSYSIDLHITLINRTSLTLYMRKSKLTLNMKLSNLCFCVTMSRLSLFVAAVKLCMVFCSTVMEVLIKSSFAVSLSSSRWRPSASPCLVTFESGGGGGLGVTVVSVVFSTVCKEKVFDICCLGVQNIIVRCPLYNVMCSMMDVVLNLLSTVFSVSSHCYSDIIEEGGGWRLAMWICTVAKIFLTFMVVIWYKSIQAPFSI